jgi:hypothetical protein
MLSKDSAPVRNLILIISNLLEKETWTFLILFLPKTAGCWGVKKTPTERILGEGSILRCLENRMDSVEIVLSKFPDGPIQSWEGKFFLPAPLTGLKTI